MRVDAEENRDQILAEARRAFAELGEDVPIARIARRAGVSVATVYRRFPTREHLVAAARTGQWQQCAALHATALRDPDPARALRELVRTAFAHQLWDRGFTKAYADAVAAGRGLAREREETDRVVAELLARAQAAGTFRADVGVADFRMSIAAHRALVGDLGPDAVAASRRFRTLVLRSLQT